MPSSHATGGPVPPVVSSKPKDNTPFLIAAVWTVTAALVAAYFVKNLVLPTTLLYYWKAPMFGAFDLTVLLANLARFGLGVGGALAASAAFLSLGWRTARLAGWTWDAAEEGSFAMNGAFAFALGAGLYAAGFLALGLCGLWDQRLLAGTVWAGAAWALWEAFRGRRHFKGARAQGPREWPVRIALILAGIPILLALLNGMTPEIFYDSLVYHLGVPREWMFRRGMVDLPGMVFSHFPYGGEMVFWAAYVLGGSMAAKTMSFLSWMAVCALSAGFAGRLAGNKTASYLAFALLASCPIFCLTAWTTQVEAPLALYGLAFLACLERASRSENNPSGWWAAAGWAFFSAIAVKYNGVLLAAFLVPIAVFPSKGAAPRIRSAVLFLVGGGVALGPWLVKNWVYAGNPVYPYLSEVFGGRRLPVEGLRQLLLEQRMWRVSKFQDWWTLPWRMFTESPNGYNFLGPLMMAAPLWIIAAWWFRVIRRDQDATGDFRRLGRLLAGVVLFFLVGLSVTHLPRFLAAGYSPLYVLTACAAAGCPPIRRVAAVSISVVALGVLPLLFATCLLHYSPHGVWTGRENEASYLQRAGVTPYAFMTNLPDRETGPRERLLLAGDSRAVGYPGQTIAQSVFDEPTLVRIVRFARNPEEVWRGLRRLGVDQVAINVEEGLRVGNYGRYDLDSEGWTRLDETVRKGLAPVKWADKGVLFNVRETFGSGTFPLGAPNPFLYLAPQAALYARAADKRDSAGRDKLLRELSALQPFTAQWLEERAVWHLEDQNIEAALEDWREASLRGPLQRGSYREWIQQLRTAGRNAEAEKVEREAMKWHPGGF